MAIRKERVIDCDTDQPFFLLVDDDQPDEPLQVTLARTFGGATAATAATALPKRLLTDRECAAYLNISRSAVRALVANKKLKRVELPSTDGHAGRAARVLRLDIRDVDAFVERMKG